LRKLPNECWVAAFSGISFLSTGALRSSIAHPRTFSCPTRFCGLLPLRFHSFSAENRDDHSHITGLPIGILT
jgi:hypothetical protein